VQTNVVDATAIDHGCYKNLELAIATALCYFKSCLFVIAK